MKAYKGDGKTAEEIPADLKDAAEEAHMELVEAAAEGDDSLLEKYLEGGELSAEEIAKGLAASVQSRAFIPVFVAAGSAEIGVAPLARCGYQPDALTRPGQSPWLPRANPVTKL